MTRRLVLLVVLLGTASLAAGGLPRRAGVARAVLGRWEQAMPWLDAARATDPGRAEEYFRAAALLELGLRRRGLDGLRSLSDGGGAFSGPALELGVGELFSEGRYEDLTEWVESSRAERFQDVDALHYRAGHSHLILGRREPAQRFLEQVSAGTWRPYALHSLFVLNIREQRFGRAVGLLGDAISAAESFADPDLAVVLSNLLRVARGRALYQLAANVGGLSDRDRRRLAELGTRQFERVSADSAAYAEALRGIGWCSLEAGDPSRALESFAAAGAIDPLSRCEDLWAQGRVHEHQKSFSTAAQLYRQAAQSAAEAAHSVESAAEWTAPVPIPAAARWQRRGERAAAASARWEALGANVSRLTRALSERELRLAMAAAAIEDHQQRTTEIRLELQNLRLQLRNVLDQIPVAALFPSGARAQVRALIATQRRLGDNVARIEYALGTLSHTAFWSEANDRQRARGTALWERLEVAKAELENHQLSFLLALKDRVSRRELELSERIEHLVRALESLTEPHAAARDALLGFQRRGELMRVRVAELQSRAAALDQPLAEVQERAAAGVQQAEAEARAEQVRGLMLQADVYALDEVQALHLLQAQGQ